MSGEHSDGAAGEAGRPRPISAKDVASGTAIGAASRLGVARYKAKLGEGAAVGAAVGARGARDRSSLLTAVFVVVVMVGSLALMLLFGK